MDTRYSNPGKILRQWFPDQTATQGMILLWTVIYLLNLALTMGFGYLFYFNIPAADGWTSDFGVCLEGAQLDAYPSGSGVHVLYRAGDGSRRMVLLTESRIFRYRMHMDKSSDQPVPEGDSVRVEVQTILGTDTLTVTGDTIDLADSERSPLSYFTGSSSAPLGSYLVLAMIPMGLEMLIHSLLKRALRGG